MVSQRAVELLHICSLTESHSPSVLPGVSCHASRQQATVMEEKGKEGERERERERPRRNERNREGERVRDRERRRDRENDMQRNDIFWG